jgi:hypothetical protein
LILTPSCQLPANAVVPETYRIRPLLDSPPDVTAWEVGALEQPIRRPADAGAPKPGEWVTFALDLSTPAPRGGVTVGGVTVDCSPRKPLTPELFARILRLDAADRPRLPTKRPEQLPRFPDFTAGNPVGSGLGIYVRSARVAVRNVRLIPIGV